MQWRCYDSNQETPPDYAELQPFAQLTNQQNANKIVCAHCGFPSDKFVLWRLVMKPMRILVLILCVSFASMAWSQQPTGKCFNVWKQFHRHNMVRSNPCERVLNVHNVGNLSVKWNYASASVESSPAVANGVVYVGSDDSNLYALNAKTGAKLWSYPTLGPLGYSSPAVANGVVYAGSYDHNLYALDAKTGAKLWSYTTGGFVESSPAVVNGVVYVGSGDHKVYALNASTGVLVWSYAAGPYEASSPAVANGVVYFGSGDHRVYALDAKTGAKLWSYDTFDWVLYSSPAVANGVVYVCSIANVYALNARTGAKLWSYTIGDMVQSSPAVANGVIYVGSTNGSDNGNVYAFGLQ
jgi:outer membrane protein assembly factor BamB